MGITPAHFWGCTAPDIFPQRFPVNVCSSVWHKYAWQEADSVGLYDVATEIQKAEREVASAIGYWPAPWWTIQEQRQYPREHRRDWYGLGINARGDIKADVVNHGKIISPGRRAVSLVSAATVAGGGLVYSDEDGDGFYETATVAVNTTLTDIKELKVYHSGYGGDLEWEIRQPRRKWISGGVAAFVFDAWLFIDPDLYELYPTETPSAAINISTTANYVTAVDVYREYTDQTQPSAEFYWENNNVECSICGGSGCEACGYVSQDGCLAIRDAERGIVVPSPATYTDGSWVKMPWNGGREPDRMDLYYLSGAIANAYVRGTSYNPMPPDLSKIIAYLATSRLERPLCACSNVEALSVKLQSDVTQTSAQNTFIFTTEEIVGNPFGTRLGEVMAYRYIVKNVPNRPNFAVI
jgi:hypothetical protein